MFLENLMLTVIVGSLFFVFIVFVLAIKWYNKVPQGKAIVRTGAGGTKVTFSAMFVIPVLHKMEIMDISLKSLQIKRIGKDGLICKDNIRADIEVAFFVRVNKSVEDVVKVAQTIGCERASNRDTLVTIFDAKFSEALKTVGRRFEFIDLYSDRDKFKQEILDIIGTDLNGYILDDCAIDYLEQTPLEFLKVDNILDSQGIKKITEMTAQQKILANEIRRNEEKVIKKQDVEAKEAILELNKQLTETEEKQAREVAIIKARERSEAEKVTAEEKLKADIARIKAEEETQIAEENKLRQIIVASKSKERTEAVETQRVEKDKLLEANEKERVVALAQIEKEKAVEEEKKNIQDVIRERVALQKSVVEEEEKIKDTKTFAEAHRTKEVALTVATTEAEEKKIKEIKLAEAMKSSAELKAQQKLIEAEAEQKAAEMQADARKTIVEVVVLEESSKGVAEATVIEAKAKALEKQGTTEAVVMEKKAMAEAKGIEAKAVADEKKGIVEATVLNKKLEVEAQGIEQKAAAMKKLDGVGKDHEEFKLKLEKEKAIELAEIHIQKDIAEAQAKVVSEALKSAKIDIVGGETTFFDKIVGSVTKGKAMDRMVDNSKVFTGIKDSLLGDGSENVIERIQNILASHGISSADIKNLSISALLLRLSSQTVDNALKSTLDTLLKDVKAAGIADQTVSSLGLKFKNLKD
ncbi:MAG: flotillin family protein [Cytophagaceae bacterium]